MSTAIYRKYRPQRFSDITNQNHVKITIQNQIANDSVAHAYLFAGPRGVGKTTTARLLAKALNCTNRKDGESEPCNECDNCIEMMGGHALDVIEIDAASHTGVDNVRENIIEAIRFAPGKGKYKIFIIDEVHMLSTSAFNALLKTLEEPPAHAVLVLATTEVHKIPQTILSRCQRFDFHRIATADVKARLEMLSKNEGVKVDGEVLDTVARLSEGCLRDAESLLGQILALGDKKIGVKEASIILPVTNTVIVVEIMDALVRKDVKSILITLNIFVDQGGSVKNFIDELIDFIRNMMMVALGGPYHDHYDEVTMNKLRQFITNIDALQSSKLLDALLSARSRPRFDAIVQLPLEIVLVEFCGVTPPIVESMIELGNVEKKNPKFEIQNQISNQTPTSENPKPTIPALPAGRQNPQPNFTIADLISKWQRCCEAVGRRNVALPLVLGEAKPLSIEGNVVTISFDLRFHFDTIKEQKNCKMLADAISEVMQTTVVVTPIYAKAEEEAALGDIAEAFGGAVL